MTNTRETQACSGTVDQNVKIDVLNNNCVRVIGDPLQRQVGLGTVLYR